MKKRSVLLLTALMFIIGGCSKHESVENNMERADKLKSVNKYPCLYDVDAMQSQEEYGFEPSYAEAVPDSFWLDSREYKAIDFRTEEDLWKTLEKINEVSVLADTDTTNTLKRCNNHADEFKLFFDIYVSPGASYTFYFNPESRSESEEPGVRGTLGIQLTANEDGEVAFADAEFNGMLDAESDGLVLTFSDVGINVVKRTSAGPKGMHLADYTDETRGDLSFGIEQIEESYVFEPAITEETENLDTEITQEGVIQDEFTCTGVKLFWINGFYINGDDIRSARAVCDAVERVSPGMIVEIDGKTKTDVTADMLMELVNSSSYVFVSLFEQQGGDCRMLFTISNNDADIEAYPTGNETIPNTRAIYETDTYTQWIPYKYTHVMHLEFNNDTAE